MGRRPPPSIRRIRTPHLDFLAEDVEWVNPPDALEPGLRQGIDGFAAAMKNVFDAWEEMQMQPERLFALDRHVVMIGRVHGRTRGIEVSQAHAHVWTLRDGKVVRFRWFSSGRIAWLCSVPSEPTFAKILSCRTSRFVS
jgi:ketosteroid isomerase-like protein